jgi:hypothetical protein
MFCSAACRQAGHRLRKRLGSEWWHEQPWYRPWRDEEDAEAERRRRKQAEDAQARIEQQELEASMPPEVRKGLEQQRNNDWAETNRSLTLAAVGVKVEALNTEYHDRLNRLGYVVQLTRGSAKVEKLLWAAVQAPGDDEAAALFAKARTIAAQGLVMEDILHGEDAVSQRLESVFGRIKRATSSPVKAV